MTMNPCLPSGFRRLILVVARCNAACRVLATINRRERPMWGHKWGVLVQHVPAFGPWLILVLGCVLGIVAVVALRSARKTAFFVSSLVLLIPLVALADFPHPKFLDVPIAHGYQVSDDLKALV